jgi:hypothetical protein
MAMPAPAVTGDTPIPVTAIGRRLIHGTALIPNGLANSTEAPLVSRVGTQRRHPDMTSDITASGTVPAAGPGMAWTTAPTAGKANSARLKGV